MVSYTYTVDEEQCEVMIMAAFSEEDKSKIIAALTERNATRPCPRCGTTSFTILDGYFNHSIQPAISGNLMIGGPSVPTAIVACNNCGFLSEHALGVLKLLPKKAE